MTSKRRRRTVAANAWFALAGIVIVVAGTPARGDQTIADNLIIQGDLTVEFPDTPAILLRQTSGGGFPAHDWILQANEVGFFVRDSTSATIPFGVEAEAPDDSLRVTFNGVGFGTLTPAAPIHVVKASAAATAETLAQFEVFDDPVGRLVINNASASDNIFHPRIQGLATSQATPLSFEGIIGTDAGANPCISFNAARSIGGAIVNRPLVAFRNNVTVRARIDANGDMFATSFSPISTRTRKDRIVDLESAKAATALRQLTPVEFVYTDDETGEQRVGFIAEDVPELVANADRQSVPIMDVVALVTRVVKDQQQTIERQQATIDQQKQSIEQQRQQFEQQRQLIDLQQKSISDLVRRLDNLESRTTAR